MAPLFSDILTQRKFQMRLRTKGCCCLKGCRVCACVCEHVTLTVCMCLCVCSYIMYLMNLYVCTICDIAPHFFEGMDKVERKCATSTDVLMHSCAQWEPCMDAVFCICWLELCQTHSDTSSLCTCSLSTSLRLCTLPQLCWKRMGDKLGLSWDPTLLINTVHWQRAPVRSKIKYIWKGETESGRMGWTKKSNSKQQLLHLGL